MAADPGAFGEYGDYRKGRLVALACGDQLFVKPPHGPLGAMKVSQRRHGTAGTAT
jgi:hypothetical protein